MPAAFPILCPHGRSQRCRCVCHRMAAGCVRLLLGHRHRGETCQFSVSWAAFQTGRSEDLLECRLLAFSLVSELFVALTDMKITYQRGMTFPLSNKSGFHLSSERAVVMVAFFPYHFFEFSCAMMFKCRAGDWQTMQQTAGGFLFFCSALHQ